MRGLTTIDVNDKYQLQLDAHTWAIAKRVKRHGKLHWEQCLWYPTLNAACVRLVELLLVGNEYHGIGELQKAFQRASETLSYAIREAGFANSAHGEHERLQNEANSAQDKDKT